MSLNVTHNGRPVPDVSYIGQTKDIDFLSQNLRLTTVSGFAPLPLRWYAITQAATDVFVYDARQDSDRGAWTNGPLAQASSWYNETLNTATRGSRRDFPKVAVIVAEASRVVIYDGEDPALPMWMVFVAGSINYVYLGPLNAVAMAESILWFSTTGAGGGTGAIDFAQDRSLISLDFAIGKVRIDGVGIVGRNGGGSRVTDNLNYYAGTIVNRASRDLSMRVLPGAPTDPTTDLKVPTVLVGTDAGLSIIKDNGTVVDVVHSGSSIVAEVGWREGDNAICYTADSTSLARFRAVRHDVPATNLSLGSVFSAGQSDELYTMFPSGAYTGMSFPLSTSGGMASRGWIGEADAGSLQLTLFAPRPADPTNGMRAVVTADYNTGWMHGDTVGAFLSSTSTTSLVGGTDSDRSPYNTPLTVNGTITRSAVATGAELVWYSLSANCTVTLSKDISTTGAVMWWQEVGGTPTLYMRDLSGGQGYVNGAAGTVPTGGVSFSGANMTILAGAKMLNMRPSATIPDADQIAKIYADELKMFQPGAACTLAGTSSDVRAVDYDRTTGRVQALAADGWRSAFEGLIRVEEQSTGKSVALSAAANRIAAV